MAASPIYRSLENLSESFTVFQPDQILTHDHLNRLAEYFDDQDRLTRTRLLGVGWIAGGELRIETEQWSLTPGLGITSDGDLAHLATPRTFDRFRRYDRTAPAIYPLFFPFEDPELEMLPVFQLIEKGKEDALAFPLSSFNAQTGMSIKKMTLLLFIESHLHDPNLCTSVDCDNLGQLAIHRTKILLITEELAIQLEKRERASMPTLAQLAAALPTLSVPTAGIEPQSLNAFVAGQHKTCVQMYKALSDVLAIGQTQWLRELRRWDEEELTSFFARWQELKEELAARRSGLQYFYEFLKDLTETYESCREWMAEDFSVENPGVQAFPKHLLLGQVAQPENHRSAFYPSPAVEHVPSSRAQAKFLAARFETMVRTFRIPSSDEAEQISVVPSRSELAPLEERAIPYYYNLEASPNVAQFWHFFKSRQGRHAVLPGRQNGAPPQRRLAYSDFYRIEGHVGQTVKRALSDLQDTIRERNLPFQVAVVALGQERPRLVLGQKKKFTDLHGLHQVLREDLAGQLEESLTFSEAFKRKVEEATDLPEGTGNFSFKETARQRHSAVDRTTKAAASALRKNFAAFRVDTDWQKDIEQAIGAASEFKEKLGPVARTEFTTPFDHLISSNQTALLSGLGQLIQRREERASEQGLLHWFRLRYPGLEYAGGVLRGGTFVLVHDAQDLVVADFQLPYLHESFQDEDLEEAPLVRPRVKPEFAIKEGIKITPTREQDIKKILNLDLDAAKRQLRDEIKIQKDYVDVFKDSIRTVGAVVTKESTGTRPGRVAQVADPNLDLILHQQELQIERLDVLRKEATERPNDTQLADQIRLAELTLAASAGEASQLLVAQKADLKEGSDGAKTMAALAQNLGRIKHTDAVKAAQLNLKGALDRAPEGPLKLALTDRVKAFR